MRGLGSIGRVSAWLFLTACGARPMPAGYAGDDVRAFVRAHRAELQAEIEIGSGRTLYDASIIAGCQDLAELSRRLHQTRDELFAPPTVSDEEIAERIVRVLANRRELRCLNLELTREREFAAGRRQIGPSRQISLRRSY